MRKVLVATHGYLADGIKSSVGILTGREDCITCIDAYVDQSDYTPQLRAFIDSVEEGDEAVIFTDMYGGSVNRENAVQLIPRPNIDGLFIGRSAWEAERFAQIIRDCLAVLSAV